MANIPVNHNQGGTTAPQAFLGGSGGSAVRSADNEAASCVRSRGVQAHRPRETGRMARTAANARRQSDRRLLDVELQPVRRESVQVRLCASVTLVRQILGEEASLNIGNTSRRV